MKKMCSENLCNQPRVTYCLGYKGSLFYGMCNNNTIKVIHHSITVTSTNTGTLNMRGFYSLGFSPLYVSGGNPGSCYLYIF